MKKLMFASMLLAAAFTGRAQTTETTTTRGPLYTSIGPVFGVGHNWVSNMGGAAKFNPNLNAGFGLVYAKDEHWGVGGQLSVMGGGYMVDYGPYDVYAIPVYMTLPLRGYYFFGSFKDKVRPKLFLGPQVAMKIDEVDSRNLAQSEGAITRNAGRFRTFDAGLNAGAGLNIRLQKATWLNLDLTYYQGLTDAVKDPAGNYNTSQNLGLSAGLLFGIK